MPIDLKFENGGAGALMIAKGYMAKGELLAANERMYQSDTDGKLQYQIIDLSRLEQEDLSVDHFKKLVDMDKQAAAEYSGLKIAVVVKPGLLESMSEVYSMRARDENLQTQLFSTLAEARTWVLH